MKAKAYLVLLLLFLVLIKPAIAQPSIAAQNLLSNNKNNNWSFEENRGQLADENGKVLKDIEYYGRDKGVVVYLRKNKISFVFSKTERKNNNPTFSEATGAISFPETKNNFERPEEVKISTSRIDLQIENANPETQIVAEEKISYYTNYYLAHTPEEGITNVPHFKKITYKNIYNNIDLVLHVKEQGMKYEFVVHPKGKVSNIKLSWNGTKPDVLQNGGIKYASSLGEINESAPFTFISENEMEVKSAFKTKGSTVCFQVEKYDESKKLIIDPTLIWGTYYGGEKDDECTGIVSDSKNNIYITGITNSKTGISTIGAHQVIFPGAINASFIAKINSNGVRQWGTYYGGNTYGIARDINNNICIVGVAGYENNIATTGAHQTVHNDNGDAFVVQFNDNGIRQWGTFYGGKGYDQGIGITCDSNNNIYIIGSTTSTTSISTQASHQTSLGSIGYHDAFIVKFNSSGVRQWGTYYGGSSTDYCRSLVTDDSGNIYITGSTQSGSAIATTSVHKTSFGGEADAFIAKFNNNGIRLWGTYYGGNKVDGGTAISTDKSGNIYITGYTKSESGIATSGVYQENYIGGPWEADNDAFIAKFSEIGVLLWGTYYAGSVNDAGNGITNDSLGNVYITGFTTSPNYIATNCSYQTNYEGGGGFIAKLNSKGSRQWGTYINAVGSAIVIDKSNNIYVTGRTGTTSGISTKGSHQTVNGGTSDGFLMKFKNDFPPYKYDAGITTITSPDLYSCDTIQNLIIKLKNFSGTIPLDSIFIGWSVNNSNLKSFQWKGMLMPGDTSIPINLGNLNLKDSIYKIKIWTFNSGCFQDEDFTNDTIKSLLLINKFPQLSINGNTTICSSVLSSYKAIKYAGAIYKWNVTGGTIISGQSTDSINIKWNKSGNGFIKLVIMKQPGCKDSIILPVTILSPTANFTAIQTSGKTFNFTPSDTSLFTYFWNFGDGDTSVVIKPQHTFIKDSTYLVKLTVTDSNGCDAFYDSFIVVKTTGIIEETFAPLISFSIYPNPFKESTVLEYSLTKNTKIKITLTDVAGREIAKIEEAYKTEGNYKQNLDATSTKLKAGVYLIHLQANDKHVTRHIIKF